MAPARLLDTHIHLWPSTATAPHNHTWMTPSHPLAKRHGIVDYNAVTPFPVPFIYVETDRHLPSFAPELSCHATDGEKRAVLEEWAKEPLNELRFLRRMVDGAPAEGDGFNKRDGEAMKGCVVWAPMHLAPESFSLYLSIAEGIAGPSLWERIVGFRYLLQGKAEGEVERLIGSQDWLENMVALGKGKGGKGWAFDVGIDTHRDGVENMNLVATMIEKVRELEGDGSQVRFVLNHLCKTPLSHPPAEPSEQYTVALRRLSSDKNIYMKLSGAFNEFTSSTPSSASDILASLHPVLDVVFDCFPSRIMFGSDWPVCNVGGPKGEPENWALWVEVVEGWLNEQRVGEAETEEVWWRAGSEAYGLEVEG